MTISGEPVARHRFANEAADLTRGDDRPVPDDGVEITRRTSPPLVELLRIIDKVSQNLHAELVLREAARVHRAIGSREAGLEELREFSPEFGSDIHQQLQLDAVLACHDVQGGTAPGRVQEALRTAQQKLAAFEEAHVTHA